MANASGTKFKRAPSSTTFYQIRGAAIRNSNKGSVGINYILFFLGSVIIAVIIFAIRERNRGKVKDIGLVVLPDPRVADYQILNLTQNINRLGT